MSTTNEKECFATPSLPLALDGETVIRKPTRHTIVSTDFRGGEPVVTLLEEGRRLAKSVPWERFRLEYEAEGKAETEEPKEPQPTPSSSLLDRNAAEQAWGDMRQAFFKSSENSLWKTWADAPEKSRLQVIYFARRFRELTSKPADAHHAHMSSPLSDAEVEKLWAEAWDACRDVAYYPPCEDSDLTKRDKDFFVAILRHILSQVAAPKGADTRTRVGQWVPGNRVMIPKGGMCHCVAECEGYVFFKVISMTSVSNPDWMHVEQWDAAVARWDAEGRPMQ